MNQQASNGNGGVGVLGLLGVAFVILKLTGHITWSWLWVLAPFWIPVAVVLAILGVVFLTAVTVGALKK